MSILEDPLIKSDTLYKENNLHECYTHLQDLKCPDKPEVCWRISRVCWAMAQLSETTKNEKISLRYEGLEFAMQGVKVSPRHAMCHKWNGIMLTQISEHEGCKKKIEHIHDARQHFKEAIELCPTDATCHHFMGKLCFRLSEVSWHRRQLANAIYSDIPKSSYKEALRYFQQAEQLSPGFSAMNGLMLGKCYSHLKQKSEARSWWEKVAHFEIESEDDRKAVKEAQVLLKIRSK